MVVFFVNVLLGVGVWSLCSCFCGSVCLWSLSWSMFLCSFLLLLLFVLFWWYCLFFVLDLIMFLFVGIEVEVCVDDDGFYGLWFEVIVFDFVFVCGYCYFVWYIVKYVYFFVEVDDEGVFVEFFVLFYICLWLLFLFLLLCFCFYYIVEVFYNEGWWLGIVVFVVGVGVIVVFFVICEVIEFLLGFVCFCCDYVDGDWILFWVVMVVCFSCIVSVYEVGDKVEVVSNWDVYGDFWFFVMVKVVIDNFSYVVEYFDLEEEEGGLEKVIEYLYWWFISLVFEYMLGEGEF